MFQLRLLGGASVEAEDGTPLTGAVAQRRRLALLALLATAPVGGVSRERLAAYLFPEADAAHAHRALSDALHAVRKALGRDAVVAAGDQLRLDPVAVRSDVGEFEADLERGELERAVARYGGPFLDGFFVPDAPELERCVEAERTRLAQRYGRALEALAERAEKGGDARRAVEWWKRLAAHDPHNSRVALRLMHALAASGDVAGAVRHARVHQTILREELGVESNAEVAAAAERLQASVQPVAPTPRGRVVEPPSPAPPQAASAPPTPSPAPADSSLSMSISLSAPTLPRRLGSRAWRFWAAAAIVFVALAGVAAAALRERWPNHVERSIAVLPFANLSSDKDNEYFADGMTEELISALTKVEGLRVPARTSSFAFKGKNLSVRAVADSLRVGTVLEGSVRKDGNRLKVTAQLVNAADGYHLWSETYERELQDVFTVQDEIARAIVDALRVKLTVGVRGRLVHRATPDPDAYDLYLKGRFAWNQRTPASLGAAIKYFEQAIAKDSGFALAYAGLADVYVLVPWYSLLTPDEAWPRAKAAVNRALTLDSSLAEVRGALAYGTMQFEWDWSAAEREFRRTIAEAPSYATGHQWYADFLAGRGRLEESLAHLRQAQRLDPLSRVISGEIGRGLYFMHRPDEAIAQLQQTLLFDQNDVGAHLWLGLAHLQKGNPGAAVAELERAQELGRNNSMAARLAYAYARAGNSSAAARIVAALERPAGREYILPSTLAIAFTGIGDYERAFAQLARGAAERDPWLAENIFDPLFDPLRADPRFARLLRQMGLERQ